MDPKTDAVNKYFKMRNKERLTEDIENGYAEVDLDGCEDSDCCPVCGASGKYVEWYGPDIDEEVIYRFHCEKCGASGKYFLEMVPDVVQVKVNKEGEISKE